MKNGMYVTKHYLPVVITLSNGEVKDDMDTVQITFLYTNGDVVILSLESKLDNCLITLPSHVLANVLHKIKDKAAMS